MVPLELRDLPQWVVAGSNKVPINPRSLHAASVTDPRTWSSYAEACAVALQHKMFKGFVFTKDDPYAGVDLDTPKNPEQVSRHTSIFNAFENTYTERSMSGTGVHHICKAKIPHAAKRDGVEIYDRERYFIITEDVIPGRPLVCADYNDLCNQLVVEMSASRGTSLAYSEPEKADDGAVFKQCQDSSNGDKFTALWNGQWQKGYSSQSEADFALVNMLAFFSRNNEQCKRMFRLSGLGQRNKALREAYLDTMLGTIRNEQYPAIDFSQFKAPTAIQLEPQPLHIATEFKFPDGLVGEVAQYIYDTAIKPIPQIALLGSMGLLAGLAGRTYNISNTGLNLYLLCIAGTAIGKEGAGQGIARIVDAVAPRLPAITQHIGPSEFASGQGLVRHLETSPCSVSVMGEFGHMLSRICSPHAIGADVMWRKLFLDLFNKSGPKDMLGKMVYSDTGKNTAAVKSPAFSIVADATAASVFDNLSEQTIEIGLIPRFILVECNDKRPATNENAFAAPGQKLAAQVESLAHRCLSMGANNTRQPIQLQVPARKLLRDFDREIDKHINLQNDDSIRQIWSRSYMKALRVSGLLAVGTHYDAPSVDAAQAEWAIDFIRTDAMNMQRRFGDGIGGGDPEQLAKLRTVILNVLRSSASRKMQEHGVVSHRQLSQRCYALACYRHDRRGASMALDKAIQGLVDGGELILISKADSKQHFGTDAKCYVVTSGFEHK